MEAFLETERLVLRRFTDDDADNLVELDGDPEVTRFINGGRPTTRDEVENETLLCGRREVDGEFVGGFALHPTDDRPPDEVELGYRLRRSARGLTRSEWGVRWRTRR